jgi:hypothetical protein
MEWFRPVDLGESPDPKIRDASKTALKIWFFALDGLRHEYAMAPRPCLIEDWDISAHHHLERNHQGWAMR